MAFEMATKKVTKKKNRIPLPRLIFIIATLAIPLTKWAVFFVVINGGSIIMAFQRLDETNQAYWTLENFEIVFQSFQSGGLGIIALKNSNYVNIYFHYRGAKTKKTLHGVYRVALVN